MDAVVKCCNGSALMGPKRRIRD